MCDRPQNITPSRSGALATDSRHRHQESVRLIAKALRKACGDRRHDQHCVGIVQERRHGHRRIIGVRAPKGGSRPTAKATPPEDLLYRGSAARLTPTAMELEPHYRELQAPVTIINGADDHISDVGRQSERLHRELPGSEFVKLPGLGQHNPRLGSGCGHKRHRSRISCWRTMNAAGTDGLGPCARAHPPHAHPGLRNYRLHRHAEQPAGFFQSAEVVLGRGELCGHSFRRKISISVDWMRVYEG